MSTPEPPPYPGDNNGDNQPPSGPTPPPGFPPPPPSAPQYGQYGQPGQAPMPAAALPGASKATTSLVTGIIGLLCCGLLGIVAIVTGKQATAEAAAVGYPQPGNAKAGIILGWIAIALMAVGVVVWILLFVIGAAGTMVPPTSP